MLWPSWIDQFTAEAYDSQWDDVEWLVKTLPQQDKNQTVKVMDAVMKKNSARHQHEWFARDGQHPDRNGHQLLYNEVVKRIFEVNE